MNIKEYLGDNYKNIILEDDNNVEHGGTAYCDETVEEFMNSVGLKETDNINELNKALKDCGIQTL